MSSPPASSPKPSQPNSPPPPRQLKEEEPSQKQGPSTPVIDPSLASDSKPVPVNPPVEYYHQPQYYSDRWQPNYNPAVFDPRYRPPPPPSHHPHHYNYEMPHRVDSADRNAQPRSDDRGQYEHHPGSHPSPPPIATLHDSPAPEHASLTSPSPPTPYYPPPAQNGPGMNQAPYPYPPHARYPQDPAQHQMPPQYPSSSHYSPQAGHVSTRSIRPTFVASHPIPPSAPYIIHTDDAATKLNDRIRRKCYNCRTTDTSTWRRSSLTPGKVLCNKCGLFERTHSRPRPEQFPHKRGPIVQGTFKASRSPPPSAGRLPPISSQMPPNAPLPPHHYDHPSIAPLMPRSDSQQSQPSYPVNGNGQQAPQGAETQQAPASAEGNNLKRPHSPESPQRSPRQEQRSPPYASRAPATAAAVA